MSANRISMISTNIVLFASHNYNGAILFTDVYTNPYHSSGISHMSCLFWAHFQYILSFQRKMNKFLLSTIPLIHLENDIKSRFSFCKNYTQRKASLLHLGRFNWYLSFRLTNFPPFVSLLNSRQKFEWALRIGEFAGTNISDNNSKMSQLALWTMIIEGSLVFHGSYWK